MTNIKDLSGNTMKAKSLAQTHYPSQTLKHLVDVIEPVGDQLFLREIPDEPINQSLILKEGDVKGLLPYVRALVIRVPEKHKKDYNVGDIVYYKSRATPINFPDWKATKAYDCVYVMQFAHAIEHKIPVDKVVKQ